MKKLSMVTKILIAVILGIGFGLLFPSISHQIKLLGDIFLKLMQMAIPILVLGQIIQAMGSIKPRELTSLGGRTIIIFGVSSLLAAGFGILMAVLFSPGKGIDISGIGESAIKTQEISLTETITDLFPKNIFESLTSGSIIQIIVFALFFGLALNKFMQSHPESQLFQVILDFNEIIIQVISYVMIFAPIGIFSLISSTISNLGIKIVLPLVKYLFIYGLSTFLFLALWIAFLSIYCKFSPLKLIKNMRHMSIMALATTSSAITLPIEMEEAHTKIGLSKRITNLVLPLGMSLNSNGSAMHMAITVVTIAQMYTINLTVQRFVFLAIMATFVSLANAVVPGAGLVSLAIIVPQMGLPVASIAIFAGVEWFVGMLRTILNVNSDVYSAVLIAKTVDELDYEVFNEIKG